MTTSQFPTRLTGENSREYAFRALYDAIMCLTLCPGQQLNDSALGEMLGISRTPIREALVRLQEFHLVDVHPQRSTSISRIDLNYVEESVFARSVLEPKVLREAIRIATTEDLELLRTNLRMQHHAIEDNAALTYLRLDDEFHRLVYSAAGKTSVWESVRSLTTHLNRVRYLQIMHPTYSYERGHQEHLAFFRCLEERREPDDELSASHVTAGYRRVLLPLMRQFPDYFVQSIESQEAV